MQVDTYFSEFITDYLGLCGKALLHMVAFDSLELVEDRWSKLDCEQLLHLAHGTAIVITRCTGNRAAYGRLAQGESASLTRKRSQVQIL